MITCLRFNRISQSAAPRLAAFIMVFAALGASVHAQFIWDPSNSNTQTNWTTGNNWTGTGPANNSSGTFNFINASQKLNNNNNLTGITMTALVFTNTAGANVITGNAITLAGGITNLSTSLQTINLAMSTTAVRTISTTSGNITIGGVISGTGGGIIKDGANVLTLSGANTYTNGTTINAGTLSLGAANRLADTGAITVSGGTFNLGGFTETVGAVSLTSGTITNGTLTGSSYTVQSGTAAAVLAGSGNLTKTGTGTVSLAAANTYTGTNFINAGVLSLDNAGAFGGNGSVSFGGGTLRYSAVNTSDLSARFLGTGSAVSIDTAGQNVIFASAIGAGQTGGLAKSGAGTLTLSGANAYSGGTLISAGTLRVGAGGTSGLLGTGNVTNNASLVFNRSDNFSAENIIGGTGSVVKQGAGTLTLSGENTFNGGLSILGGAISVAQEAFLGASNNAITLDSGTLVTTATVDLGPARSVTFGAGGGTFDVATGTTATVDGLLSGSGSFTKIGAGTISLDAASSGYAGNTFVNAGTLALNDENVLASSTVTVASGATIVSAFGGNANIGALGGAGSVVLSSNAVVGALNTSTTVSGVISGNGALTKTGSGTLTLASNNSHAGGFAINGNGAVRVQKGGAFGSGSVSQGSGASRIIIDTTETVTNQMSIFNIAALQTVTLSGNKTLNNATYDVTNNTTTTESGTLTGDGGITKLGAGTLLVTASNSFTGVLSVQAGVLDLDSSTGSAAGATASVSISSGATLLISQSNQVNDAAAVTLSGGTITRGGNVGEVFGNLNLTTASFLDYGAANAAGTIRFGTYTPSSLLTVQNFLPGNKLQFGNTISLGDLNNTSLFQFSNGFTTSTEDGFFTITAIPEPSTYAAAAGLIGLMLWPSRRRIIRDAKKILGFHPPMRDRLAARRTN